MDNVQELRPGFLDARRGAKIINCASDYFRGGDVVCLSPATVGLLIEVFEARANRAVYLEHGEDARLFAACLDEIAAARQAAADTAAYAVEPAFQGRPCGEGEAS